MAFELTERKFALVRQVVLLLLSVALCAMTIGCTLHGCSWAMSGSASGSTALTGLAASFGRHNT
jgi:hypothetical protein